MRVGDNVCHIKKRHINKSGQRSKSRGCTRRMHNTVLKAFALGLTLALAAPVKVGLADGIQWTVQPDFENSDAALEISGATCAGSDATWCFAVNDEKKYIQVFSMQGRTLKPGDRIRILEKRAASGSKFAEPDLEAITYGDGFVYLSGSFGLSRKKDKLNPSRFLVYRFPVDRESGEPAFDMTRKTVAPEIVRSKKLGDIIKSADGLSGFAEQPLRDNGANVEGLAIKDDSLFFGFRAPATERGAVVLQVKTERLFGDAEHPAVSHFLDLGVGYGIRDMAVFGDGFLILSGAAVSQAVLPAIWHWVPDRHLRLLKVLPVPEDSKSEGLMIVDAAEEQELRVLVLFDSLKNGAPTEFTVPLK